MNRAALLAVVLLLASCAGKGEMKPDDLARLLRTARAKWLKD